MPVRNLPFIRTLTSKESPGFGAKLYETLSDIIQNHSNTTQQTNTNAEGEPLAPPALNGIQVTAQNGYLHVALTDNGQIYRGIRYYVEHADNAQFTDPQIVPLHDSRNVTIPIGYQTRYVRAYSAYEASPISAAVVYGGSQPIAVNGGGSDSGPLFLASQGSGTGGAGVGLSGPGPVAFRSNTGIPPVR